MINLEGMNWTDEQWKRYENATVTVRLPEFERLATAVNLVAQGRRLTRDEQRNWTPVAYSCRETVSKVLGEITEDRDIATDLLEVASVVRMERDDA